MQITQTQPAADDVIVLSGAIGRSDVTALRRALVAALDSTSTDLLVDARSVTAFDDSALIALNAVRSRAKFLRRGVVVLDVEGGSVESALRRSGHLPRLPVQPDPDTARSVLAERRAVRARLSLLATEATEAPHAPAVANPGRRVIA